MYHILKGERKYAFKTYQKITTLFKEHHGYMSFADLRDHQVTVLQLAEMEEEGSLETICTRLVLVQGLWL